MSSSDTWVVLPTYQEAENLATLIPEIRRHTETTILVVDDNSQDGTVEIVERLDAGTGRIRVLSRPQKAGLGSAYRAGMREALENGARIVVTMDADWSHHPRHLPELVREAEAGSLAIGSRYVPGGEIRNWPAFRYLLSSSARLAARGVLGPVANDITSGYRAYPREALETVPPESVTSDGYSFLIEMATYLHHAGFSIVEKPIVFEERREGVSKISRAEIYLAIGTLWRARMRRGHIPRR